MTESDYCEVVNLSASRYRLFGNEYSSAMAPHVVSDCLKQGLNPAFAEIFKAHLDDLQLVIRDDSDRSGPGVSELDVLRIPQVGEEKEGPYRRLMIVSRRDLDGRVGMLRTVLPDEGDETQTSRLRGVALDWCYYELAFSALNNACFMERTYGCYINDFDGQGQSFRTQYTLSVEFLEQMGSEGVSVEDDFLGLKSRFGLMMLTHSLLRHKVVRGAKRAEWISNQLSQQFPHICSSEELSDRLKMIQPDLHAARRIAELAISVFDPTLDEND